MATSITGKDKEMIDGIKIMDAQIRPQSWLDNEHLDFPLRVSSKNEGEILNKYKNANYNDLLFTVTPTGNCKLKGSLHKFLKGHNSDDFTYLNLVQSIISLWIKFGVDPHLVKLNNLEFGVNLNTQFNPSIFIDNLIQFKGVEFNKIRAKNQNYAQAIKNRYIIKIYDKGLQYNLDQNVLRYEIKVTKSEHLKQFGITYLIDLIDPEVLLRLGNYLIDSFDGILYWDESIDIDNVKKSGERELLISGTSSIYWNSILKNKRRTYYNRTDRFKTLVDDLGGFEFWRLRNGINEKWLELLSTCDTILHKLTDLLIIDNGVLIAQINRFTETDTKTETELICQNSKTFEKSKIAQINTSYKMLIRATSLTEEKTTERKCKVTGIDISCQKAGSNLLSHAGLKFIIKTNPDLYKFLVKKHLTGYETKFEKGEVARLAKQIRNIYYNPKRYLTQAGENQKELFELAV